MHTPTVSLVLRLHSKPGLKLKQSPIYWASSLVFAGLLPIAPLQAAVPDAGQSIQQLQQPISLPKVDKPMVITPAPLKEVQPGGAKVRIDEIVIEGNRRYSQQELLAQLGADVLHQEYDMAGIQQLANQLSQYYRQHGYPFAKAYLPAQELSQGKLFIKLLEGYYGQVKTSGDNEADNEQAQVFLEKLIPNEIIESKALERATLLLSDQPGISITPVMQPGARLGQGDLVVHIKSDKKYTGSLGIDNQGNYYTGENRLKGSFTANSPFVFGDQLNVTGIYAEQRDGTGMWLGSLGYNRPLGGDGWRMNMAYSRSNYQLGKDFKALSADGVADIYSLGVSYALVRSQQTNLTLNVSMQHKSLQDDPGGDVYNNKDSNSLPVSLNFDTRDAFAGGGITFGALTWTPGELYLDHTLTANDANNTRGRFNKYNLEIARLQSVSEDFSLYLRGSVQWADKNLDSSEGMGLGGANAVRAYPLGEGYGNVGWLTQAELRYQWIHGLAPYAFYDVGSTTANQTTYQQNSTRELSGAGVGMRYQQANWDVDVAAAWRINGGPSEDKNNHSDSPRVWASVRYLW